MCSSDLNRENIKASDERIPVFGIKLKKDFLIYSFIVLFILFFLIQNYFYIKNDANPQFTDRQFNNLLVYYRVFYFGVSNDLPRLVDFPPLVYFNGLLFIRLFGYSMESARLSILVFNVIFLLAMYGIGRQLGKSSLSGIAVMVLAASSPIVNDFSRRFFLDYPQTATTALAFYFLLKSHGFSIKRDSIFFGISLALAFLVKWSAAFFLIFPLLWFILPQALKSRDSKKASVIIILIMTAVLAGTLFYYSNAEKPFYSDNWLTAYILIVLAPSGACLLLLKKLIPDGESQNPGSQEMINFAYSSIIFAALVFPWFFWAAEAVRDKFFYDMSQPKDYHANFIFMLTVIKSMFNFSPILILTGIFFTFKKYRNEPASVIPVTMIFLLFIMSRLGFENTRYYLSFIIFIAALSGYWVAKAGKAKYTITGFLIVISVLSVVSWLFPLSQDSYTLEGKEVVSTGYEFAPGLVVLASLPPVKKNVEIASLIENIETDTSDEDKDVWILVYADVTPRNIPVSREYIQETAHGMHRWLVFDYMNYQKGVPAGTFILPGEIHRLQGLLSETGRIEDMHVREIVIFHEEDRELKPAMDEIARIFAPDSISIKTINNNRGFEGYRFSILRMDRQNINTDREND